MMYIEFKRLLFHRYTFYTLLIVSAALTLYFFAVEPFVNLGHGIGAIHHAVDGEAGYHEPGSAR